MSFNQILVRFSFDDLLVIRVGAAIGIGSEFLVGEQNVLSVNGGLKELVLGSAGSLRL